MPLIPDYDRDEEAPIEGRKRLAGLGGRPAEAAPTPQQETPFVPWSRFVSANQEVAQREAGKLQSQTEAAVKKAQQGVANADSKQVSAVRSNYDYTSSGPQSGSIAAQPRVGPQTSQFGATTAFQRPSAQQPQQAASIVKAPTLKTAPGAAVQARPMATAPSAPAGYPAWGGLKQDRLSTDTSTGAPVTSGFGLGGSPTLQGTLGDDAWKSLVGDTAKAQNEADALGSASGVQALLGPDATAFDAALVGGAGGQGFRDLSSKYGDNALSKGLEGADQTALSRWQRLMGDVQTAGLERDRETQTATDEMNRLAAEQAVSDDARAAAADAQKWLREKFPIAPIFELQDGFLNWVESNRDGQPGQHGYSNLMAWAQQIYGEASQAAVDRFYADVRRMTPEEYEAFKYGIVPSWMGQGEAAAGMNGGTFYGLGNTGRRISGQTTTDTSGLSEEDRKDYESKMKALNYFYQALALVATAAAGAVNPALGAAVGAATQAGIQAQGEATGAKG